MVSVSPLPTYDSLKLTTGTTCMSAEFGRNCTDLKKQNTTTLSDDSGKSALSNNQQFRKSLWMWESISPIVLSICESLRTNKGVHSWIDIKAAGFHVTDDGCTWHCKECGLKVSSSTSEIKPFDMHKQRSPSCSFVRQLLPKNSDIQRDLNSAHRTTSDKKEEAERQTTQPMPQSVGRAILLIETNMIKKTRQGSFSHWNSQLSPSPAQLTQAGFFSCNVGDRVICLYCNLICQQWIPHTDDPYEVHKTLSPKCPFVLSMLTIAPSSSLPILNENLSRDPNQTPNETAALFRPSDIVFTTACHRNYSELPRREASFSSGWPEKDLPPVDDLVRAGFFYSGTQTIVTCFYCNGSLQNWGPKDIPMIEHARWFPNCAYAKQLCGLELYKKIQESKRAQQGKVYERYKDLSSIKCAGGT